MNADNIVAAWEQATGINRGRLENDESAGCVLTDANGHEESVLTRHLPA